MQEIAEYIIHVLLYIKASKVKSYCIEYESNHNTIVKYEIKSVINQNFDIIDVKLDYKNIFSHRHLLKLEDVKDCEPNYIETPNFVKKLNK